MRLLITGICGFVGSRIAITLQDCLPGLQISGIDNFIRPGSETNREQLKSRGIRLVHGDLRNASDVDNLPPADWVIDAAANPSVLAGVDGKTSSRQLLEHNLGGTINLLEFCKTHTAGFTLLSTSRVYSIPPLAALPVEIVDCAFRPDASQPLPVGLTSAGVNGAFSTASPISLYGATKLASENLALEYGATFGFPVWINRCGVLAGAGQFGRPDQGIFAYWINSWLRRHTLRYIGFDGTGAQTRDVFHPDDLAQLIAIQIRRGSPKANAPHWNLGGGVQNAMSLNQLSRWCEARFGTYSVAKDPTPRPFDIPWMVMDSKATSEEFGWTPTASCLQILEEIAVHAEQHPHWLALSAPL